jgi:hypothetical protein
MVSADGLESVDTTFPNNTAVKFTRKNRTIEAPSFHGLSCNAPARKVTIDAKHQTEVLESEAVV